MTRPKILVSHRLPGEGLDVLARAGFEVLLPAGEAFAPDRAAALLGDVYGIVAAHAFKITRAVLDAAPALKIVANIGTGVDNIDVAYAAARGVAVANNPTAVVEPTGELAYALMLDLAREISLRDRQMRSGEVRFSVLHNIATTLLHKKLGIVGLGSIGRVVARYAHASRMEIVYHNRTRLAPSEERALGVRWEPFDRLVATSDFITLHVPLGEDTRHMFSAREFAMMKPTAFIVNTARGAIVDVEALERALEAGEIAGAALDVFENEPHYPRSLTRLDNVVLTPHMGTGTRDARTEMTRLAAQNIVNFHAGHGPVTLFK